MNEQSIYSTLAGIAGKEVSILSNRKINVRRAVGNVGMEATFVELTSIWVIVPGRAGSDESSGAL